MKIKAIFSLFTLFLFSVIHSQKLEYSSLSIPDSLKTNANAVVRLNELDIRISSQRNMNIRNKRVITILNAKGLSLVGAREDYDKKTTVKKIEATIYNSFGVEINKVKRKDFRDQAAIDGITVFSDSRFVYLDYTPVQYPFTIVYESEVETSNTAFIQTWYPINDFFESIEKSVLNVVYAPDLGFKKKEFNFSGFTIQKEIDNDTQLRYVASNILSQKEEDYSPGFGKIYPKVMMGLENFNIEGVDGTAKNWSEFGKWYADKILAGTEVLTEETKVKIKNLVGAEEDPIKKAKIIYDYVQQKTRYVSIQVGIGGWKPMYASDVDRLGYGDCKALSNYTKALLNVVGVPSYNTLLYGDKHKRDIDADFVSMQGNHMILCIPNKNENVFLECTSQVAPFGYQANFTDDRNVLIIKPEGGEIVHTKNYENHTNYQISKGEYKLDEKGDFSGKISIESQGSQYEKSHVEQLQPDEKEAYFKKYWANINNLKINSVKFKNDKEKVAFTIDSELSASNYGNFSGNKMMFAVNAYNQYRWRVNRIRNRKKPFEITRGFLDIDVIQIELPIGFTIEFLPSTMELNSKFGDYKVEFVKKSTNQIEYKRSLFLKKGLYSSVEYDDYRLFMEQISRNDNAKMILTKN